MSRKTVMLARSSATLGSAGRLVLGTTRLEDQAIATGKKKIRPRFTTQTDSSPVNLQYLLVTSGSATNEPHVEARQVTIFLM